MRKLTIEASGGKGFDKAAQQAVKEALSGRKLVWTLKDHYLTVDDGVADPGKIDKRLAKFLASEAPPIAEAAKLVVKKGAIEAVDDYQVSLEAGDEKPFTFTLTLAAPKGTALAKRWKSPADKAKASFDVVMDPFLSEKLDPTLLFLRRFTVEVELTLDMRPDKAHQAAVRKAIEKSLAPAQKRADAVVAELAKSYQVALKKLKSDPAALKDAEKWLEMANRKLTAVYNGVQPVALKAGEEEVAALAKKTPRLAAASLGASVVVNFTKLEMGSEIEPMAGMGGDVDGEKTAAAAEALGEKTADIADALKQGAKEQRKLVQTLDGLLAAALAVEKAAKDAKDDDDPKKTSDDAKDAKALLAAKEKQEKLRGLTANALLAYQRVVKEMTDGSRRTREAIEALMKTAKKENFATEDMRNAVKKAEGALKPMRKNAAGLYVAFNKIGGKLMRLSKMVAKPDKGFSRPEAEKTAKELASSKPFKEAAELKKNVTAVSKLLEP